MIAPLADAVIIDAPLTPDAPGGSVDAPPTPDATPCTPIWQELLQNGDFDSGPVVWTIVGGTMIRSDSPIAEHSGTFLAWFLGGNNRDETLSQTVVVPVDASALRLRGSRCWTTTETTMTTPYDLFDLELRATNNTLLETLQAASNLDAASTCSWSFFELPATSAYAGQSIQLVLHATSDGASVTNFYLDTLELQALACP